MSARRTRLSLRDMDVLVLESAKAQIETEKVELEHIAKACHVEGCDTPATAWSILGQIDQIVSELRRLLLLLHAVPRDAARSLAMHAVLGAMDAKVARIRETLNGVVAEGQTP